MASCDWLTIAVSGSSSCSHVIGKLPASDFAQMPEAEHASLDLTRAAGVTDVSREPPAAPRRSARRR